MFKLWTTSINPLNYYVLCLPKVKHKLQPGQKHFRRVTGASILALKKNIRCSLIHDKSIPTMENSKLNIESTSGTESCDSESWNINVLNKTPIVISDTESDDSIDGPLDQKNNHPVSETVRPKCSLSSDKVNDIAYWIAEVNAENENKEPQLTLTLHDYGSESGNDFMPKEKVLLLILLSSQ
ncbi:hypothetical protein JTB14_019412 [Gonioctena quinquepunctata]|nr:hypothetical protein JTB14_019412 [Gonioctena quinquepunctata]